MKWSTHYTGGALCGLVVAAGGSLSIDQAATLTAGAIAASIAPDVDAKLNFFRHPYDHRGLPHSLVFGGGGFCLLALIAYLWLSENAVATSLPVSVPAESVALVAPGAAIGYLSHLALDAMNWSGIWLAMPRKKRIGLPRKKTVKTGSLAELGVWAVMVAFTVALAVAIFAPALGGVESLFAGG